MSDSILLLKLNKLKLINKTENLIRSLAVLNKNNFFFVKLFTQYIPFSFDIPSYCENSLYFIHSYSSYPDLSTYIKITPVFFLKTQWQIPKEKLHFSVVFMYKEKEKPYFLPEYTKIREYKKNVLCDKLTI